MAIAIYIQDNVIAPSVIAQDSLLLPPTGAGGATFTRTTDIVLIDKHGMDCVDKSTKGWRDQKCVRDCLKGLVYTKMQVAAPADVDNQAKWDLLTPAEKSVAAHWWLVGKEEFLLEVVNNDEYWTLEAEEYRTWTKYVKSHRVGLMEATVFRRCLNIMDAKDLMQDLDQVMQDTNVNITANVLTAKILVKQMSKGYVEGIDGSVEDTGNGITIIGLLDWVDGRVGTPFENGGLRYTTKAFKTGHTSGSVADEIMSIADSTW